MPGRGTPSAPRCLLPVSPQGPPQQALLRCFPLYLQTTVLLCPGCWFQAVLPGLASRACMEINKAFGLATSEWRGWSPQGVPPSLLGQPAAQVVSAGGRRAGRPAVWVATQGVGSGSTCPGQPLAREPTICCCLSMEELQAAVLGSLVRGRPPKAHLSSTAGF